MNKQITKKSVSCIIALNKKVLHNYYVKQRVEAGLVLEGWEVKSIRDGSVQLRDSYVIFRAGEAWLIGAYFPPISNAGYIKPNPKRSRKLLLIKREISTLFGAVQKEGLTVVPVDLHWHKNYVKAEIALVKGKKIHDKRETIKCREWEREKHRILKQIR